MTGHNIRVMMIDDDKDDFMLVQDLLREIKGVKYDIKWIPDFNSAINALKEKAADVYLIDYRLNAKTGLDILDELKDLDLKSSIILLSGHGDHEVDIAAMEKGASDFLSKNTITSEILERSIRYCMKRAQDQEKIRASEKLKIEKEASDTANKSKSQFLANMSHEIRTPLGAILGFAELALNPRISNKEKSDFISIIKKNGEHLLELINDILDLSKLEAGQLEIIPYGFNWRSVLNDVIELLRPVANAKGIVLSSEINDTIPEFLISDSCRFRQIILNLAGNAIKFTEKGEVKIKCYMRPDNGSNPRLTLSVSDTGIGINASEQKKLFKPFKQANTASSRKYGGTGLGLDLSRKLALLLRGDLILAQSSPGVGSIFILTLPGNFDNKGHLIKEPLSIKDADTLTSTNPFHILLVEDNIENQTLMKYFLNDTGFELEVLGDAQAGIKRAFEKDFDIILMDIQLPGMDGYEATKRLLQNGFRKPIIAVTASAMTEERDNALRSGFADYITKPIQRQNLIATLNRFKRQINSSETVLE